MNIVVSGTGYVGLITAVCLAEMGNKVTCVDVNKEKINLLKSGKAPILENGLEELMQKNKERLIYTSNVEIAYKEPDIIFIAVGTPERKDGSVNLKYVYEVVNDIVKNIQNLFCHFHF